MTQQSSFFSKPIPVLYEDDQYVVFDKPARMLVIPSEGESEKTLTNVVNFQYVKEGETHLHPCHRLDLDTSGVIVFAKGKKNQQALMDVFENRAIKKIYIAFVEGILKQSSGIIDSPVASLEEKKYKGKAYQHQALTKYRLMENTKNFSIVEVELITGRTNQIRVHFSELGHPLVGDRKYSRSWQRSIKFRRTALHAHLIEFTNPLTQKKIQVKSELPLDMKTLWNNQRSTS